MFGMEWLALQTALDSGGHYHHSSGSSGTSKKHEDSQRDYMRAIEKLDRYTTKKAFQTKYGLLPIGSVVLIEHFKGTFGSCGVGGADDMYNIFREDGKYLALVYDLSNFELSTK